MKAEFAGQKPIKTSVVHCRGRQQDLELTWEEELWIPVTEVRVCLIGR